MHRNLARRAICVLVLAGTLPALAAEGRIPIFAPGAIGVDGKYIVTRDIFGTGAGPVIDVLAPNVDIDLNGFTLTEPAGAFPVINVPGVVVTHLTIRNGSLNSGSLGIEAAVPGNKLVIEDVKIQGATTTGIRVPDIEEIAIRRVMIQDVAGGPGILLDGPALQTAVIEDSVISDIGGNGITFLSGSVTVLNNRLSNTAASGLPGAAIALTGVSGSLVSENTVVGSGFEGIAINGGRANKLFDNVVSESDCAGIHLSAGVSYTLVLNNVASNNGFGGAVCGGSNQGLWVEGDFNEIDRNVLNGNSSWGLFFALGADFNTFGRNMARANAGPAPAMCPPLIPPDSCDGGVGNSTFGDNFIAPLF